MPTVASSVAELLGALQGSAHLDGERLVIDDERAFRDRERFGTDPRYGEVPLDRLLSDAYADEGAADLPACEVGEGQDHQHDAHDHGDRNVDERFHVPFDVEPAHQAMQYPREQQHLEQQRDPDRHLGGLSSGGLGFTDTGDKSVIGGLSREFYHRVWKHYNSPAGWRWERQSEYGNKGQGTPAIDGENRTMWIFEPHVAEAAFEALVHEVAERRTDPYTAAATLLLSGRVPYNSRRRASMRSARSSPRGPDSGSRAGPPGRSGPSSGPRP